MTTKDKIARRKLSLLELATDMDKRVQGLQVLMGYSRRAPLSAAKAVIIG